MKLPINWLKEFVKFDLSAEELSDRLTMTGQEVDSIETDAIFEGVVIGEVIERIKHPNADKLNVAKVRVGKDTLQIVCGAPNLNVGQKVPVALVGAKLGDFEISKVELRGVESHGMICSEKELGLGENHEGIMVLEKKAEVGTDFGAYYGTEKIIDIKVQANRPDCMGIIGLARETAVTLNKKFIQPEIKVVEKSKEKTADLVKIDIKDKELCPRYVGRVVKNVKIAPSPEWMQKRLLALNVRPINNLVDISNYVMLETGQPLHFFDLSKLSSLAANQGSSPEVLDSRLRGNDSGVGAKAEIIVRRAAKGEEFMTLDGVKRKLTEEMLVIADQKKAIALAGVMGGANTEVDEKTTDVFIEAAVFNKANVRRTSRALGLRSEAVGRFEKGVPLELPIIAIDRAVELLAELAGGEICQGRVDELKVKPTKTEIELDLDKLNTFLGVEIPEKEVVKIFDLLGFNSKFKIQNSKLSLEVPWWRPDVKGLADLYEEVIRVWGYDKLPSTLPKTVIGVPPENKSFELSNQVRKLLADIGLTEIITYSFIGKKELEAVGENIEEAPKVANPLVSEQEYMRTSILPSMLMALRDNQFNKEEISLFEIGKTFKLKKGQLLPLEEKYLAIGVIGGKVWPINQKDGANYYMIKGIVKRIFEELGLMNYVIKIEKNSGKIFTKGQSAKIMVDGKEVGVMGEVAPKICSNFNLKREAGLAVLNLDLIQTIANPAIVFRPFSKYPKIVRDISAIYSKNIEVNAIIKMLVTISELIYKIKVIDIYEGKPLTSGEKSVTLRLEFQSMDKTLTDDEVDRLMNICKDKITKLGGKIRGVSS